MRAELYIHAYVGCKVLDPEDLKKKNTQESDKTLSGGSGYVVTQS